MAGCSFENGGYITYQALTYDLVNIMIGNGFKVIYPDPAAGGITAQSTKFTLEADTPVDPLAGTQPWRVHFDASDTNSPTDPGTLRVYVGTPIQLPKDGSVAVEYLGTLPTDPNTDYTIGQYPRLSGELTCGYYRFAGGVAGAPPYDLAGQGVGPNSATAYLLSIPFASKHFSAFTINVNEVQGGGTAVKPTQTPIKTSQILDSQISYIGSDSSARPVSFRASISDHGFALCLWEEGQDLWGNRFSWFVVQRPVNSVTGAVLKDNTPNSRCPVFCVYSIGGGEPDLTLAPVVADTATSSADEYGNAVFTKAARIYRFTVREIDVHRPSVPVLATVDSPDARAIINGKEQVSITEGNQYVISFINGFNTARYMYKEEIDMVTYCSADVISAWSNVVLQPYTDPLNNNAAINVTYKAMQANLPDNAGMRILMLVDGQGVSGTCHP